MELTKEIKHVLTWNAADAGVFTVTIINHQITELHFCELCGQVGNETKCLTSTDYKFLKQVHTSLGELFNHLEKESLAAGHKFAGE